MSDEAKDAQEDQEMERFGLGRRPSDYGEVRRGLIARLPEAGLYVMLDGKEVYFPRHLLLQLHAACEQHFRMYGARDGFDRVVVWP
jgi:hypothetical protein